MLWFTLGMLLHSVSITAQSILPTESPLQIQRTMSEEWIAISSEGSPNTIYRLERAADLKTWSEAGVFHGPFHFIDPATQPDKGLSMQFYRLFTRKPRGDDDWKNQITLPNEPFLNEPTGFSFTQPRWVKFAIVKDDPARIFFQDSGKYPFHYDFAAARLPEFEGLSRQEFDRISLFPGPEQRLVLGAILTHPLTESFGAGEVGEIGIQFVSQSPYDPSEIVLFIQLVARSIFSETAPAAFYMPTFEQGHLSPSDKDFFESNGIQISSPLRWASSDQCYSPGWAIGRLRYIPAQQIDTAYAAGDLLPTDILLTDIVPAEIPNLAGVITLSPSTANSHVAILARSFGAPFIYLINEDSQEYVRSLTDQEIVIRVIESFEGCDVTVAPTVGPISAPLRSAIASAKAPSQLNIPAKETFGAIVSNVEALNSTDIRFFGGKAANYSALLHSIPKNTRPAIALSFDLWDSFMEQTRATGNTLADDIRQRLSSHSYPPNVADLRQDLAAVRRFIEEASFSHDQRNTIIEALDIFNPNQKLRFRSSTNVEDGSSFSGAGLYSSFSGCLLDDLDDDEDGPSHCDPTKSKERGVFRAIRKVYASFYNENAFIERLRYQIDESTVAMGVLIHHSFPDEIELANGVATGTYRQGRTSSSFSGDFITQTGATSVANPDGNAKPEHVTYSHFGTSSFVGFQQGSSLLPLGDFVMNWNQEYKALGNLIMKAAGEFMTQFPDREEALLDFEYKLIEPRQLIIKQVREIPAAPAPPKESFLFSTPTEWEVFQGEFGDIYSNHRLKSKWQFTAKNSILNRDQLSKGLFADIRFTRRQQNSDSLKTTEGAPETHPGHDRSYNQTSVNESWQDGEDTVQLNTNMEFALNGGNRPMLFLRDGRISYSRNYNEPVFTRDFSEGRKLRSRDTVTLRPRQDVDGGSLLQDRSVTKNDITINTRFYWPAPPTGPSAGYTAPLIAWVETSIVGLTAEPIIMTSEWSQSYLPGHHNFWEEFLFEPNADPLVTESQKDQLKLRGIAYIYLLYDFNRSKIELLDKDGNQISL